MSDFDSADTPLGGPPPAPSLPPPPPPAHLTPPPNFGAYNVSGTGTSAPLHNVGALAKWITRLMVAIAVLSAFSVSISFNLRGQARDFLDGKLSGTDFTNSFGLTGLLAIVTAATTLAVFVLTIIWMFRLASNNQTFGRVGTWVPGWAIGGWFLPPCVLYVIPFLMMRDLWKGSDPQSGPEWKKNPVDPVVATWWILYGLIPTFFIGVTFSGASSLTTQSTEDAARKLVDSFTISTLASVCQLAAAIAFIQLVRRLTARHKQFTGVA